MSSVLPDLEVTSFIDGAFTDAGGGGDLLLDPATGQPVTRIYPANQEQAQTAVGAARRAFDNGVWPRMPAFERGQVLRAIADGP